MMTQASADEMTHMNEGTLLNILEGTFAYHWDAATIDYVLELDKEWHQMT
jgi:hypothetical protein